MKQQILRRQLEFPFMEEMRGGERCRWQFGIRDLFNLITYSAIGISGMYLSVETIQQISVPTRPKVHAPLFETPYGMLIRTAYTLGEWRRGKNKTNKKL